MPTMLIDEPLGVTCVFSDGSRAEFSLDGSPNPHLARDQATGPVDLVHPHGTADSASTVNHYVQALRQMVRVLAGRGFTGAAAQLRRGQLAEFRLGSTGPREACTRAMVKAFAQVGGVLSDGVLELAEGRPYNLQPNHHQLPPYTEAEWQRLTEVCRTLADDSYAAQRQALANCRPGQASGFRRMETGKRTMAAGPARPGERCPLRRRSRLHRVSDLATRRIHAGQC